MTSAPQSPTHPATANTTVLAFDFGEKRIGVAVGDRSLRIAHPLATLACEDNKTRFAQIANLLKEWRPCQLVVGLPMHPDGTEHELSRLARRFSQRLEGRFGIPVVLVDERYSSRTAESRLHESGMRSRKATASLDAAAAQEILQAYFDSQTSHD